MQGFFVIAEDITHCDLKQCPLKQTVIRDDDDDNDIIMIIMGY
jgi:hypothetical protein